MLFFSEESKQNYAFDPNKQDGYFAPEISETAKGHQKKDIKEYFHIYPWGRIPAHLKDNILSYYKNASTLAAELLDWV